MSCCSWLTGACCVVAAAEGLTSRNLALAERRLLHLNWLRWVLHSCWLHHWLRHWLLLELWLKLFGLKLNELVHLVGKAWTTLLTIAV